MDFYFVKLRGSDLWLFLFNKDRCTITDNLFLEISWEDGRVRRMIVSYLLSSESWIIFLIFSQPIQKFALPNISTADLFI